MSKLIKCSVGSQIREGNWHKADEQGNRIDGDKSFGYHVTEIDQLGMEVVGGYNGIAFSPYNNLPTNGIVDIEVNLKGEQVQLTKDRNIYNAVTKKFEKKSAGSMYTFPKDSISILTKPDNCTEKVDKDVLLQIRIAQVSAGGGNNAQASVADPRVDQLAQMMSQMQSAMTQLAQNAERKPEPVELNDGTTPPPANNTSEPAETPEEEVTADATSA